MKKKSKRKVKKAGLFSDKIDWSKVFSEKNIEKAYKIYKIVKQNTNKVQSDNELLKKLRDWWNKKMGQEKPLKNVTKKNNIAKALYKSLSEALTQGSCEDDVAWVRTQLRNGNQKPVQSLVRQRFPGRDHDKISDGILKGYPVAEICK